MEVLFGQNNCQNTHGNATSLKFNTNKAPAAFLSHGIPLELLLGMLFREGFNNGEAHGFVCEVVDVGVPCTVVSMQYC